MVKAALAHPSGAQAAFFMMAAMVIGLKFPTDLSDGPPELCNRLGVT
jgi:hypothetical protein